MRRLVSNWRYGIAAIVVVWFVSLVLRDDTGWIVRQHFRIGSSILTAPDVLTEFQREVPLYRYTLKQRSPARLSAMVRTSDRLSGKVDAAIVHALLVAPYQRPSATGPHDMTAEATQLHRLVDRFPREPALYAAILRACMTRPLLRPLEDGHWSSQALARYRSPSQAELDSFDQLAATGERLDPGNAAFPFIRAIGLFEARKPWEAIAALDRAGACSRWDDYHWVELAGGMRVMVAATDDRSTLTLKGAADQLPTWNAVYRSAARVATIQAANAERRGDLLRGALVRHAVMKVGGLMRRDASTLLGCTVAGAVAAIPMGTAGGRELSLLPPGETVEPGVRNGRNRSAYLYYLRTSGLGGETAWVERLLAENDEAREIIHGSLSLEESIDEEADLIGWRIQLMGSVLALMVGLACAIAGTAAARTARVREGLPMPAPGRWGIVVGLLAAGPAVVLLYTGLLDGLPLAGVLVGLSAAWYSFARRRADAAFLSRTITTAAAFFLLAVVSRPFLATLLAYTSLHAAMAEQWSMMGFDWIGPPLGLREALWLVGAPLLLTVVFAGVGVARRVPVSVAVARAWARHAVLVAIVLFAYYGFYVDGMQGRDSYCRSVLAENNRHPGEHAAWRHNRTWPATVGGEK